VRALSLNPIDNKIGASSFSVGTKLPTILGLDGADVAVLVGPDVIDFKLGNEVFYASQFTSHGGSHADYKLVGETIGSHNPQA
jgi:NADPH2:quinone reductase